MSPNKKKNNSSTQRLTECQRSGEQTATYVGMPMSNLISSQTTDQVTYDYKTQHRYQIDPSKQWHQDLGFLVYFFLEFKFLQGPLKEIQTMKMCIFH
jgi:hypothetical protein